MTELCLTLVCPPALEERLGDFLLVECGRHVFSSQAVAFHGHAAEAFGIEEQVLGRLHRIQFQIFLEPDAVDRLLERLHGGAVGTPIHYWITPLTTRGTIA